MKKKILFSSIMVLLLLVGITGLAFALTINVKQASLGEVQGACVNPGGAVTLWHFVITQLPNQESAPASIHVTWNNGAEADVPLGNFTGGTAHYTTAENIGSLVTDATAVVPDDWGGEFNLSHVNCQPKYDLTVTKTVTPSYVRTYKWTIDKNVDVTEIKTADFATFNYTIDVVKLPAVDSDWAVSGMITVYNPNPFPVSGVNVTDAIPDGACTVIAASDIVPAGGSADFSYECLFGSNPGSGTNTATVTWTDFGSPSTSATATAGFTFGGPTQINNNSITVTDTNGGSWDFSDSGSVGYSMRYDDPAGTCTDHDNIATIVPDTASDNPSDNVTVTVCVGADLDVTKTAIPTFTRTFDWTIDKSVDTRLILTDDLAIFDYTIDVTKDAGVDSDWAVTGTVTVDNPNDWEAIEADLTDVVDNGGTCALDYTHVIVPASGSVSVGYACTFSNGASGTNTATASWDAIYFTPNNLATGSAGFDFTNPTTLVKDEIDVTDTLGGSFHFTDTGLISYPITFDDPAGTCTDHTNIATIVQTGASDSEAVTDCVGADLTVTKTAVPTFTRTYDWTIEKSSDFDQIKTADLATFNYTVTVTRNNGTDSLWAITGVITVNNPNDWEAIEADLTDAVDTGGSCTLESTYVVVPALGSVDVGYACTFPTGASGTNTATASWDAAAFYTPNGSASGNAGFAFNVPTALVNDEIDVTDTMGGGPWHFTDSGQVSYPFTFDDPAGTCTDHTNIATIQVLGGTASKTVEVCVGADLTVTKTANPTFIRTFDWTIDKNSDFDLIKTADLATFNYTIDVTKDAGTDSDWAVTGTVTVNNPNDWEAVQVDLTDAVDNGGTCVLDEITVVVPASGSVDVGYACTFPTGASGTNTATATWDAAAFYTPSGSASGNAGFDFTVPATLVNDEIDVTDTFGGSFHFTDSGQVSYPHVFIGDPAGTCTDHTNIATIEVLGDTASKTVEVCVGMDLTVTKTAIPTFTHTFGWTIEKSSDFDQIKTVDLATFLFTIDVTKDAGTDSDWAVTGVITVNNPNDWEAIEADLTDVVDNGGTCVLDEITVVVPASGSVSVDYACTFPTGASGTNTATASWDATYYATPSGSASGNAGFDFTVPTTVVNDEIDVTDTFGGMTWHFTDSGEISYTYTFDDPAGTCTRHENIATITQTDVAATKTVEVCVGADPTIEKTVVPTFVRTYAWDIAKDVDKTLIEQVGGVAVFNYTVHVWETGFADSDWALSGVIKVTNLTDWEDIVVDVTDELPGAECTIDGGGLAVTVLADDYVELNYECTFAEKPEYGVDMINTATMNWDNELYYTPEDTASSTATFQFATPSDFVNKTVTITDAFNGGLVTLGTLTATDELPYATTNFKYAHIVNVPAWNCVDYTNTAVIVETKQSDRETVRVCGPINTGALTMGYWQNKNGQGLIKSNCTGLYAFLKGFSPFADLTNNTCSGIASYVSNVIKAANSSGASMNKMLKAQMLATALDVWYLNIGDVEIDTTRICTDISCTSYEDASPAFNGSSTLLGLLYGASSQSNAGGSIWYGNDKALQELAKDTFDAINNEKVFAP